MLRESQDAQTGDAPLNMHTVDASGFTPLISSCCLGSVENVRVLIEHGAHVNAISSNGLSPLMAAATAGHDAVIAMLCVHSDNYQADQGGATRRR